MLIKLENDKKFNRHLDKEKKEQVFKIISHTIIEACQNLAIPIPSIKTDSWSEGNGMNFQIDQYRLNITDEFIKNLNHKKLFTLYLRTFIFHECYHAWHWINMTKYNLSGHNYFKSLKTEKSDEEIEDIKLASRSELAAELYALKQIKNTKTNSAILILEKAIAILDLKSNILINKKLRKNLKPVV